MPAWITRLQLYERHLSALAMVGGFIFDNFAFGRLEHPATQIAIAGYLLGAALTIAIQHYFEARAERAGQAFRWRAYISAATQFALGGLWSAFLIFYSRSAAIIVSWPFLIVLASLLIANEYLREYHSRLVFTTTLFFIALFTYMTFLVPIAAGTINEKTYLLSGVISIAVFVVYLLVLTVLGRKRMWNQFGRLVASAGGALLFLNVFYFLNLLPPIPLALSDAGVYHRVWKTDGSYYATGEQQPWRSRFGFPRLVHVEPGKPLYFFSAVYAPIALKTRIVHDWQFFDSAQGRWVSKSKIAFPIRGGRDNGYRGYSMKANLIPGEWRVDVDTVDGRVIGRILFKVVFSAHPPDTRTFTLQ